MRKLILSTGLILGIATHMAAGTNSDPVKINEVENATKKNEALPVQNVQRKGWDGTVKGGRISMNVTVPKQTQGATFGEKVNAGKINISLIEGGCVVLFPSNEGYRISTTNNSIRKLTQAESAKVNAGLHAAGGALSQGASLLGGALPGGAIISAAVSSVGNLSGSAGGGAAAASYARKANTMVNDAGETVWGIKDDDCDAVLYLPDGEYELNFVIAQKATSGLKDTLKSQVRIGFSVQKGVLKTKHDTAKNSVGNIR